MITALIVILLALYWLMLETNWLRIRLAIGATFPLGASCPIPIAVWLSTFDEDAYHEHNVNLFIPKPVYYSEPESKTGYVLLNSNAQKAVNYNDRYTYVVCLSPGVELPLVSRNWLNEHWNDLVDYKPWVELKIGDGYKQTFTLKKPELMKKIVAVNMNRNFFRSHDGESNWSRKKISKGLGC